MLELELKNLAAEIVKLREAIAAMTPVESKPDTPPAPAVSPEPPPQSDAPAVSVDDVLDICMTLTRRDRSLKDPIKELIAKHGDGASTVKQVPPSNLGALAAALKALS